MERRWKVLIVTAVAVFVSFLDVTIVNVAFPDIEKDFPGTAQADLSWVLNAYNIVFAALLVPAGRIADLVGRRRMFFVGMLTFVAASMVAGAAPTPELLVAARVLQAAGGAVLVPTSLGLLLPEFPPSKRATATAIWTAAGAVAAAVGPSLGGVLVDAAGWRWVFFVNLPIALVALVPARRVLREIRDEEAAGLPDLLGSALLVAGVALIALGIVKGPEWGWDSAQVLGSVGAGLALLPVVVIRSLRHRAPVIEISLFRVRSFAVANAGMLFFSAAFYALLLANVLFLTGVWHWSILHAGVAITPAPIMAALSAPFAGLLSDRFGQRVVALPGALLFAAGCGYFAIVMGATPDYVNELLPGQILTGMGVGFSFAAWGSAAVAQLPPARFATGSAVLGCLRQIGAVLGIAILIALLQGASPAHPVDAFSEAWTLMAGAAVIVALTALALGRVRAGEPAALPSRVPAAVAQLEEAA
jgi:EmrB/QacA subfamily drug resistance transporter